MGQAHSQASSPSWSVPKHSKWLHVVPLHINSEASAQNGGSGVHCVGGQHTSLVHAKSHWSALTGVSPPGQVPSSAVSVHVGAGPPQHGLMQTWPMPHVASAQSTIIPPLSEPPDDPPLSLVPSPESDEPAVADAVHGATG